MFRTLIPSQPATAPAAGPGVVYRWTRRFWRFAFFFTMRVRMAGRERVPATGGVILAVTHLSHLDPVVVSTLIDREVSWMARTEFYRQWLPRSFMHLVGAFPVDRRRPGLRPIRESLRRLQRGGVVGIFPEGEITRGPERVVEGGGIKPGAMYLSALSGCPVVPVLVIGTEKLSAPWPWLPAKWGRLWVRFGAPLQARPDQRDPAGRAAATAELAGKFRALMAEAGRDWDLPGGRGR